MNLPNVLHNPYHYSAAVVCRLAVSVATFIWSGLVLVEAVDLDVERFPAHAHMNDYLPIKTWAACGIVLAMVSLYRVIQCRPPHWLGSLGYALQSFFWIYLSFSIFANQRPLPPGAAACVFVVAVMSIYAFAANPRTRTLDARAK